LIKESNSNVKELSYISIGISTIIVGGIFIFQVSMVFPIPGVKYIMMSPYLSMVIYILLVNIKSKYALLKIGTTFGFIMMLINPYMGLTIIMTSILSQISIRYISTQNKASYGAVLFSGYAGVCALLISKFIIGGVFKEISNLWLIITGLICLSLGATGQIFAKKTMSHFIKYSVSKNKSFN